MMEKRPKLLDALTQDIISKDLHNNAIISYTDGTEIEKHGESTQFIPSGMTTDQFQIIVDNTDGIIEHLKDADLHWTKSDYREYKEHMATIDSHSKNEYIHITQTEREYWNAKETEAGAQEKANIVQVNLEAHIADIDLHTTKKERDRWNNTYTREEVANMVSNAQSNSVWKQAVDTFDDLYIKYPNAEQGWICTVLDTMITYCHDGKGWVVAFVNTMPLATEEINGLMSAENYHKLLNIDSNANYYIHPDNVECRHVTDLQIKKWDNKADTAVATIFKSGLMAYADKEKLDTVERNANYYNHPTYHSADMIEETDSRQFVTKAQIEKWDKPLNILASETQNGAMSKEMYIKLLDIEDKANYYVHPIKHSSTDIAEDVAHRFVTDIEKQYWNAKEESTTAQKRADDALSAAKKYADDIKNSLLNGAGDAFNTLNDFAEALGNDPNFATTITVSLSNKVEKDVYNIHVKDMNTHLTTIDRDKLDSVEANANYYVHPESHPASLIETSSLKRFVSDEQIKLWDSKAPGDIATSTNDGIMSKEQAAKLEAMSNTGKIRSDWTQTDETADSFILHKPTALPADGGNSETVGDYSIEDIRETNKSHTVIIGTDEFQDEKHVDFICTGENDQDIISQAISAIGDVGGTILLREGKYYIQQDLEIFKSNIQIIGTTGTTIYYDIEDSTKEHTMISITGDNNTISNISFDGRTQKINANAIYLYGNRCIIENSKFFNTNNSIRISGKYNKVKSNHFEYVTRGIIVESPNEETFGLIITGNTLHNASKEGIVIMSSQLYKINTTIISENVIYDAYTGIRLTNEYMDPNTVNTIITSNNIMRGNGITSDYLYEQRTVYIEYASHVLINGNMIMGRDVFDKTDGTSTISMNNMIL